MNSNPKKERFQELCRQSHKLNTEALGLIKEQLQLSHELQIEAIKEAFPGILIENRTASSVLKPNNNVTAAEATCQQLIKDGRVPDLVIVDANLMQITLYDSTKEDQLDDQAIIKRMVERQKEAQP